MASSQGLLVVVVLACFSTGSLAQTYVRLVSASLFDPIAAANAGYTNKQLAQDDIDATVAALKWQNNKAKGTVIKAVAGLPLNENFVNGVSTPEWGSYVKVIDFKTAAAYQVYAGKTAPSFSWPSYTKNKQFLVGNKIKWVGTLKPVDSTAAFPAAVVFHISMQNATAGNDAASVANIVNTRLIINKAIASLTLFTNTYAWTPALAATDAEPQTVVNFIGFTSPQAAISYKAYKSGNPPGPVPALPLYVTLKAEITTNRDIEFLPILLAVN